MSSLDMSLDDIAKQSRPARGGASRGGRGGSRGGSSSGRGGSQNGAATGPVRNRPRYSGGASSEPYTRGPVQQYAPIAFGYQAPAMTAQWKHDLYQPEPAAPQPQQTQQPTKKISGDTIHVSNLADDVTDEDVREIFERIGTVRSCTVNYNSAGRSLGTATVTFARKQDAERAVEEYDEAEVDSRPMKIKLIGTVVTAPVVVKKAKPQVVAPAHAAAPVAAPLATQLAYIPQQLYQAAAPLQYAPSYAKEPRRAAPQQQQQQRGGGGAGARAARGGRVGASNGAGAGAPKGAASAGPKAARGPKKPVTGEDLDKEMEAYHSAKESAAKEAPSAAAAGQPTSA